LTHPIYEPHRCLMVLVAWSALEMYNQKSVILVCDEFPQP
jgi:hypothetical protein